MTTAETLLELSFPRRASLVDFRERLADAITSLAAIEDKAPQSILRRIARINRDALCTRVIPAGGNELNSVTFSAAAHYVADLQTLFSYAATVENNPTPHFGRASNVGSEFVEECRFAHTFRGSFGFVVETPPLPEATNVTPLPSMTFPRRVMERLATGFDLVRQGVANDDITTVSNNYREGLNANLCETVIKMSGRASRTSTEFSVNFGGAEEPRLRQDISLAHYYAQ